MYNENQLTETVKPYDSTYVVATSDIREFQSGHISLIDLFNRQFRVPSLFKGLDTPAATVGIGSPTYR